MHDRWGHPSGELRSVLAVDDSAAFGPANDWLMPIQSRLQAWVPGDGKAHCALASVAFDIPPADRSMVLNAAPKRQAEFIGGRWCAHTALRQLGVIAPALPKNEWGAPLWPLGILGSITHESGVCAAAVSRGPSIRGIGIDLFDLRHASDILEIAPLVLASEEMALMERSTDAIAFVQRCFCLKEAVVKAISSGVCGLLDLRAISLIIHDDSFAADVTGLDGQVTGQWGTVAPFSLAVAVWSPA